MSLVSGGSRPGRALNLDRERGVGHDRLWKDYFAPNPVYSEFIFRQRFQMTRRLFLCIVDAICEYDDYFVQKPNCAGILGLSPLQCCTTAFRMLAYRVCVDATDEYCRFIESTCMEFLKRLFLAI